METRTSTTAVAPVVQGYLQTVRSTVNELIDPSTQRPVEIPDFAALYEAAGHLDATRAPERSMFMIQSLLGRASSVDCDAPSADYQVQFPRDHHLHAKMGLEWYWVGCHLDVVDRRGKAGRLSVLLAMQKIRSVGAAAQHSAGWTDHDVGVVANVVTITVDMGPDRRSIHRRSPNYQWPLKGGSTRMSVPGENFCFACGPDALTGSANVLPLRVRVDDGENMQVALTFAPRSDIHTETSFFLQGVPSSTGDGGTGVTPLPTPGIYYSWPQLSVSGSIIVGGTSYNVQRGTGWIDHQLMMTSLANPSGGIHPVPFVEDPEPYHGWVWQFYNLDNGQAFTGAGFVQGPMSYTPPMSYGYFLLPSGTGGWKAIFIEGAITLADPRTFPAICALPKDSVRVTLPIKRSYANVENPLLGDPLSGNAVPWYEDGTFNNPDGSLCGEFPADYVDTSGKYANGVGYMETVGFQKVAALRGYMLAFLEGGVLDA